MAEAQRSCERREAEEAAKWVVKGGDEESVASAMVGKAQTSRFGAAPAESQSLDNAMRDLGQAKAEAEAEAEAAALSDGNHPHAPDTGDAPDRAVTAAAVRSPAKRSHSKRSGSKRSLEVSDAARSTAERRASLSQKHDELRESVAEAAEAAEMAEVAEVAAHL